MRALLLAALMLTGCASPMAPPPPPPSDAASHQVVTWTQPGLFERFPSHGPRSGWSVGGAVPAPDLPFYDEDLQARWGNVSLIEVSWVAPAPAGAVERVAFQMLRLEAGPRVKATLDDAWGEADVKAAFLAFARNASAADEGALREAADALWASRQAQGEGRALRGNFTVYAYEGTLPPPLRLAVLLAGLRENGTVEERKGVSSAGFEGGGWSFAFELAFRRADRKDAGVQRGLMVDGADEVAYTRSGGEAVAREALEREVRDVFDALGLGAPELAQARFQNAVPN